LKTLIAKRVNVLAQCWLVVWSLLALLPLYFMVSAALKTEADYTRDPWGFPTNLTLANFVTLFGERGFGRLFINSFVVTGASIVVTTLFAVLAAYAIAQLEFPGRSAVLTINNALMGVPIAVILIPVFLLMANLHLVNTYTSAIVVYVGLLIPWSVYLLSRFFERIPREILDAAVIDGCGDLGLLARVIVPLSFSAIATMMVTNFLWAWNELLLALVFLQDESVQTLMPGVLSFFTRFTWQPTLIMASLSLIVFPVVALYLLSYRVFIAGVGEGALK
jgi:ABC-type glycerol-3-phosphate transport system permease component